MPDIRLYDIDASASSSLIYLVYTVWARRKVIALFTVVLLVIALAVGLLSPPLYQAEVTAYPVSSMPASGRLSAITSAFGLAGAADLANAGIDTTPPVQQTLALLQSRALTLNYLYTHNAVSELFPERWDAEHHRWKSPDFFSRLLASWTSRPLHDGPTDDEVFRKFDRLRTVSMDQDTGVITLSVEWSDPRLAAKWANGLIKTADDTLRNDVRNSTQKSLTYLQDKLAKTSLSGLRDAIYSVATREITKGMMASAANRFAIQVIDPAVPPDRKAWPSTAFLIALALLAGLFFGSLGAIAWAYVEELRATAQRLGFAAIASQQQRSSGQLEDTAEAPARGDLGSPRRG